jgi:hypothetical protein
LNHFRLGWPQNAAQSAFAAVVSIPFKPFFKIRNFATPYIQLYSWSGMGPVLKLRLLQ